MSFKHRDPQEYGRMVDMVYSVLRPLNNHDAHEVLEDCYEVLSYLVGEAEFPEFLNPLVDNNADVS